jgi:hypothetical protein
VTGQRIVRGVEVVDGERYYCLDCRQTVIPSTDGEVWTDLDARTQCPDIAGEWFGHVVVTDHRAPA